MKLLTPADRAQLESLALRVDLPSVQRRAQLLILYDDGLTTREIAAQVGLSQGRVRDWRRQYEIKGMNCIPPLNSIGGMGVFTPLSLLSGEPPEENRSGGEVENAEKNLGEVPNPEDELNPKDELNPMVELNPWEALFALQRPGVEPGDSLAEAGRKVLRFLLAQMLRHEEGTRQGNDIEELHDMRVATRRMRAAFIVFEDAYKPKVLIRHLKGLRATGRALGRVRDLDVFMEKAEHYLDSLPEIHRRGLDPLLDAWQSERESSRSAMLAHLGSSAYCIFKNTFYAFLSTSGAGARHVPAGLPVPDQVQHIAPVLVYNRLAAVRAFEPILNTASLQQLHALRIEFKKLRYTLEFFTEVLGEEAKEIIVSIKTLQDHLGDLNDANVACQILRQFLDDWEIRQSNLPMDARRSPEPILAYLAFQHAERYRLMIAFRPAWVNFDQPEIRHKLALALSVL